MTLQPLNPVRQRGLMIRGAKLLMVLDSMDFVDFLWFRLC
uniref:Uncharacterized protein n=1 Tax=Arundo donax TaxID=35708 RepID=A0A0A9FTU9_ARUDO